MTRRLLLATSLTLAVTACGETARQNFEAGIGPNPTIVEPNRTLFPTVKVAEATGWPPGALPAAAPGLRANVFAQGLQHPRWLHVLPNGDVLVAESNKPKDAGSTGGPIKQFFMKMFMKKAGAGVPSADRITLLRDGNGDGVAEQRSVLIDGLKSPFGMAFVDGRLFIANADALVWVPFTPGQLRIDRAPTLLAPLPSGRNHHWTKSLTASGDGRRLYVGVGSNSDHGENGLDEEQGRAAVWEIDPATGARRLFASGLRNPVGVDVHPQSGQVWVVVNERDELGSDLVPDYLTSLRAGGFYGWPWSYYGNHVDGRVKPPRPDMVARTIKPDYALGAHVAPLGLTFAEGARLGPAFASGAFIGEHGSWNRNPRSGYKVVFVPFAGGRPSGMPIDVLTGFLAGDQARGRPVGVAIGRDGSLLVADDVGNAVWRVSASR